jgi:hypothetical protein
MATQLIKHLQECAKTDEIYKPLESQWTFDERLIAKALQNVSVYFPHYSRHDESHSRQILVHIERLLGAENISKLTATDTWLLLEAAYLHDIGMIISDEHLKNDYDEIKKYVEKTKHLENGDTLIVMNALLASKEKTASSVFASVDISPFHAVKLLREIIADFYRTKHPERANSIILEPLDIGLNSPRNELLPRRFFGLLGKICAYHGASFEKLMELPKQQVGIGIDDCHPRFIACLLRLGDLLDLDDNRFCPVMMKMAGELPRISEAHHQKHLAIRHFRADPELIEVEADCPSYESYIETTKWFGWLREEVKNQMGKWFDIVPSRDFGLLPSVGDLKAHLKDWQVFSEDKRPQFTLDRDRMFELLQGAGIYDGKEQAMRELLQNAVDATLIRIWREHGEDTNPKPTSFIKRDSAPPRDGAVRGILEKYPLDVKIEKENEEEQFNYWRITITDQGTGISRHDLEFLMSMGSSKKNHKKRAIAEKMPIWMKPSGIFGIGFHSVFLLTNEVIIETRSIDTGETLLIRLTSPTNEMEHGNIYFQIISEQKTIELPNSNRKEKSLTVNPWDFSRYGCQLSFVYKTDTNFIPKVTNLQIYDGLLDSTDDFQIINLSNNISNFFDYSYLKGRLNFASDDTYQDIKNKSVIYESEKNTAYFYAKDEKLELIDITAGGGISLGHHCFYRGQEIKTITMFCSFGTFSTIVNFLDDEADKILSISRNDFKKDIEFELANRIASSIKAFFSTDIGKQYYQKLNTHDAALIAAGYKLNGWSVPLLPDSYFQEWQNCYILIKSSMKGKDELKSIKEIACYDNLIFFDRQLERTRQKRDVTKYNDFQEALDKKYQNKKTVFLDRRNLQNFTLYSLIILFLKNKRFYAINFINNDYELLKMTINPQKICITNHQIYWYCKSIMKNNNSFLEKDFLKRRTIPCLINYDALILKNKNQLASIKPDVVASSVSEDFSLDLINSRMLFPLARIGEKITVGDLDILAKRVYKNRANEKTTEEEIKMAYQKFIQMLDNLMKNEPEWVKLRGSEFSL